MELEMLLAFIRKFNMAVWPIMGSDWLKFQKVTVKIFSMLLVIKNMNVREQ